MDRYEKTNKRILMRLNDYDYSQSGYYFVTICLNHMQCLFGSIFDDQLYLNPVGKMIETQWHKLSSRFTSINLHDYVVMPNHFHGIIEINQEKTNLSEVIGAFKSITTNEYIKGVKALDWQVFKGQLWQRGFHDKIIRDDSFHSKVVEYINHNPAKCCDDKYFK